MAKSAKKPAAPAAKKGKSYSVGKIFEKKGNSLVAKNKHCPKCKSEIDIAGKYTPGKRSWF